jgi:molybdopterin-guanine dinucleotide biosynthesis protein A
MAEGPVKSRWYHFSVNRAGYVLAGGRSSRMGQDKALLPFRGATLVQAVAGQVAEAAGSAVLVGDPDRYDALGYPVIPDDFPGEGPLGGIVTALRHTSAEWNLVAACDMPGLSRGFLEELLAAAENNRRSTVPVGPSGRLEPLCAVWRRDSLGVLETAFRSGIRKVGSACESLRMAVYPVAEVAHFQNVNTPEDWAGHAAK